MTSDKQGTEPKVPFGKEFKKTYFPNLGPKVVSVNHGSYGLIPQVVQDRYIEALKEESFYIDAYIRGKLPKDYRKALHILGEFLNCDFKNLALVDNTTVGVNTILRSYPFEKDEKVVMSSTIYGSCGNTVKYLAKQIGLVPIIVDLKYPVDDEDILAKYEAVFRDESPKLCMFDAVSSMPGIEFPFLQMDKLCKKYNVLSLIDGAHSVGLIPLDLSFEPDFYVSNLHKWLYVPRGCAVMYIDKKHHRKIQTLPISHSYVDDNAKLSEEQEENLIITKFEFNGTKSYCPIQCIETAIEFRRDACGGESKIQEYCNQLADKVGETISSKWGTEVLHSPEKKLNIAMVNVIVPFDRLAKENGSKITLEDVNDPKFEVCQIDLLEKYNTMVPVEIHNNKLLARFSCQIYNELSDYEYSADCLLAVLVDFINSEQWKKFK